MKFTLHFATINTTDGLSNFGFSNLFTLHFATINTVEEMQFLLIKLEFTLHFATINTSTCWLKMLQICYLHYTLLLLIRFENFKEIEDICLFTLHFATINTDKVKLQ